MIIPQAQQTKR